MIPDYTINDAWKDGFEDGVWYILRYAKELDLSDEKNRWRVASYLELKKPWRTMSEWFDILTRAYA